MRCATSVGTCGARRTATRNPLSAATSSAMRALRQWLRAGHYPPLRGTHYPPLRQRHGVSLCGRIRVPQPCATACAPREVAREWRPAGPREALRACTGSRLRVASPLATSWRLGGRPVVAHLVCTLATHRAHRRSAHLGRLGVRTVMSRRVQHLDDQVTL